MKMDFGKNGNEKIGGTEMNSRILLMGWADFGAFPINL